MKYIRAFLKKLLEIIDKELSDQKRINAEQIYQITKLKNEVDVLSYVTINQLDKIRKLEYAIHGQKEKIRSLRCQIKPEAKSLINNP